MFWKIINLVLLLLRASLFTASQSVILVNSAFNLLDVEAALFKSVKVSKLPIKVVSSAYMIGANSLVAISEN